MDSPRIISLIASATEMVCALGLEDALVGRSHECDFPPQVLRLPACSEPRIDPAASSREIDRQVKTAVADALSIYQVRREELERLQPTHIITQTQCEVCAVSLKDVQQAVCGFVGSQPRIVSLAPTSLADVWADVHRVAEALDVPERGKKLVAELQGRLDRVAASIPRRREWPTVVCLEWLDPLMSAGNWLPELVEIAGGRPLLAEAGEHSPWMTWEDLQAADPDVLVLLPCGFDIPRTRAELQPLRQHPAWPRLKSVRNQRVFLTDGNQYFNRPGPRLVESTEILAEILHGVPTPPRHRGNGWVPLP
jgi:iron complex transport system substrate-binding protein